MILESQTEGSFEAINNKFAFTPFTELQALDTKMNETHCLINSLYSSTVCLFSFVQSLMKIFCSKKISKIVLLQTNFF